MAIGISFLRRARLSFLLLVTVVSVLEIGFYHVLISYEEANAKHHERRQLIHAAGYEYLNVSDELPFIHTFSGQLELVAPFETQDANLTKWGFNVQPLLDRPGNQEIQLALFLSYGSNPPLYPKWQAYFRKYQPPTLIVWGKNDEIFPAAGAHPYQRDLNNVELHLLDTGHFAIEEDGERIAALIRDFLRRKL